MGKIANALEKSAQERKTGRLPTLTRADLGVLISYDHKTGRLLNPEAGSGRTASGNNGTLQRLLDHKLVFPGGKLTPRGLAACERLKKRTPVRPPRTDAGIKARQKTAADIDGDDVIIQLEEEVDPSTVGKSFPPKKTAARPKRPAAQKITVGEPDTGDRTHAEETGTDRRPAVVPSLDDKKRYKNLVSLVSPQSYEAEQFKILRNNILFPLAGQAPQSILITSSLQGEGKSFVAANLAVSIAMNVHKHVLLIDCDLRKPDLHRIFGLGDGPGLSDYLAERCDLASLLQRTRVERLSLLPGGPIAPNPSELMSSERMAEMLEEVKQRYSDRLIVIDSPPPGLAAETSYLARQVDGILLVVQYGKTPREDVEDLMDIVGSEKILGTVINYLDLYVSKRYGYGKYGTYGSGKK